MLMFIFGLLCIIGAAICGLALTGFAMSYPLSVLAAVLFFPTIWWLAGVWQKHADHKRGVLTHEDRGSSLDDPLEGLR